MMIVNLLNELYYIFPVDWYYGLISEYTNIQKYNLLNSYQIFTIENLNIFLNRKFSINEYMKQHEQINKIMPENLYNLKIIHIKRINDMSYFLNFKIPNIESKLLSYNMDDVIIDLYTYPIKTFLSKEINYENTFLKNIENKMSSYGLNPNVPPFIMNLT